MEKFLIMTAGLPGTGKTSMIKKLMKLIQDYQYLDHTGMRRELGFTSVDPTGIKDRIILDKVKEKTHEALKNNIGIIIDSVHRHRKLRKERYEIAKLAKKEVIIIEFFCSKKESLKRIKSRPETKNGLVNDTNDEEVYDRLAKEWEPIEEDFQNNENLANNLNFSYIKLNTENIKIEKIKITQEAKKIIELIENIIKKENDF